MTYLISLEDGALRSADWRHGVQVPQLSQGPKTRVSSFKLWPQLLTTRETQQINSIHTHMGLVNHSNQQHSTTQSTLKQLTYIIIKRFHSRVTVHIPKTRIKKEVRSFKKHKFSEELILFLKLKRNYK